MGEASTSMSRSVRRAPLNTCIGVARWLGCYRNRVQGKRVAASSLWAAWLVVKNHKVVTPHSRRDS